MKNQPLAIFLFSLVHILFSIKIKNKNEDHWLHHSKRIQTDIP